MGCFYAGRVPAAKFDVDSALTLLYHNENLQVTYGAVILSALGKIILRMHGRKTQG
jgi:hypothetical protein